MFRSRESKHLLLLVYFIRAAADEVVGELAELAIVIAQAYFAIVYGFSNGFSVFFLGFFARVIVDNAGDNGNADGERKKDAG